MMKSAFYAIGLLLEDNEYGQTMPPNCRSFEFQCKENVDIRWSMYPGHVDVPTYPTFMTLKAGGYYYSPTLTEGSPTPTLYFAAAVLGVTVEVIAWYEE
jgi:hypothetical protein